DMHPADLTDFDLRGMEGDAKRLGSRRGRHEQRGKREQDQESTRDQSLWLGGRCCRRNCSISDTSSDAGGRSLPLTAGSSSASLASSFATYDAIFLFCPTTSARF